MYKLQLIKNGSRKFVPLFFSIVHSRTVQNKMPGNAVNEFGMLTYILI